ncbi:hypothetical protein DOY81_009698 [Sarcophaga bullata]|nr:hypothetical protein DOY81_009698 [Sarcophaga bullata]
MVDNIDEFGLDNFDDEDEDIDGALDFLTVINYKIKSSAARATSPTFRDINLDEPEDSPPVQKPKKQQEPVFAYYDSDDSYAGSSYASDEIMSRSTDEDETIETEQDIEKFNKQLSIIQATKANDRDYHETKNLQVGYNFENIKHEIAENLKQSKEQFDKSTEKFIHDIRNSGMLVEHKQNIKLPSKIREYKNLNTLELSLETYKKLIPYASDTDLIDFLTEDGQLNEPLNVETLRELNLKWLKNHPNELYTIDGCGDLFDCFNDSRKSHTSAYR